MAPFSLKHLYSVLFAFTYTLMPLAACYRLYSKDLDRAGLFARNAKASA